jgi:hypothetical protein
MWARTRRRWRCRSGRTGPRTSSDRGCGHQRRDPAGEHAAVLACSSPTGPGLRGRADQLGPAGGAGRHRAGGDRPRDPRAAVQGHRVGPVVEPSRASTRRSRRRGSRNLRVGDHRGGGRDADGRPSGRWRADRVGRAGRDGAARAAGAHHAYLLHDGTAQGGPRISVTQGDIRAIQLAKSALYAGRGF